MIRTSKYTNLTASITGRGKRGLFALGEVAQKKLYTAEHIPSSSGEWGLFFTLLSLAHAAAGIPPNFPRMAHSVVFRIGHHHTTGDLQSAHRLESWAASTRNLSQVTGWPARAKLIEMVAKCKIWPQGQQCTRERKLR